MNMENLINIVLAFFSENSTRIIWVLSIIFLGRLFLRIITNRIISRVDDRNDEVETGKEKRAKTLAKLLFTSGNVAIYIMTLIAILQGFGIDPMPILAGAGVLGFAIGFGAQTLIKDFLAGAFIFAENQFAVGDKVKIGQVEGEIYSMSMRSTVLRDTNGNIVFIPNGTISMIINYSLGEHDKKKNNKKAD